MKEAVKGIFERARSQLWYGKTIDQKEYRSSYETS